VVVLGRVVEVLLLVVVLELRGTMDVRVVGHPQMLRSSVVVGRVCSAPSPGSGRSAATDRPRSSAAAASRSRRSLWPLSSRLGRMSHPSTRASAIKPMAIAKALAPGYRSSPLRSLSA
jgi:hypothetical protein